MGEVWKPIQGYEGLYEVSGNMKGDNDGKIVRHCSGN